MALSFLRVASEILYAGRSKTNSCAVIGGAVGGGSLVSLVLIILLFVLVLIKVLVVRRGGYSHNLYH